MLVFKLWLWVDCSDAIFVGEVDEESQEAGAERGVEFFGHVDVGNECVDGVDELLVGREALVDVPILCFPF
jgi:hypothetical protein